MQKVLDSRFSNIVAPLPVINDQSLSIPLPMIVILIMEALSTDILIYMIDLSTLV